MRGSWVLQWPITTILSVHWGREDYVFLCRGGWIKERNQASQKCGRQSREWQQEKSREMAKKALNQFAESHGLHFNITIVTIVALLMMPSNLIVRKTNNATPIVE